MAYTHRQRALDAILLKEPDRVPMDLGSTGNTGITKIAYDRLKSYLGINTKTEVIHKAMQLVEVEEEVLLRFDIDFRGMRTSTPQKPETGLAEDSDTYTDEWSVIRKRPPGALYYDVIKSPFEKGMTSKELDTFDWPDPDDPERIKGIKEKASYYRHKTDYATVLHIGGGFITQSQYLRGFEGWFEDIMLEPELLGALLDVTLDFQKRLTINALKQAKGDIDIIHFGDDLGTQNGLMISPDIYRKIIKPRQAELFDAVIQNSNARIFFHTCGSVYEIMDDLIEIGIDIYNPVQHSARGMDCVLLKKKYGDRIAFWGGIDTQHVLPFGSRQDVRKEVRDRINMLSKGGGYVLNAIHNIQPDVKPENICEMYDAGKEYGQYQTT